MNLLITIAFIVVSIVLEGCGKSSVLSDTSSPTQEPTNTVSVATPIAQTVMTAWQQGETSLAISNFVDVDWTARPLFSSSSVLSLTEEQFKTLSNANREAKSYEMTAQLALLKQLVAAVEQAGLDAVSKGDALQARKYFTSLKQAGAALESSNYMLIVQLVGKGIEKRGKTELAKIEQ